MDVQDIARLVKERILCRESARLLDVRTFRYPASLVHRIEYAVDGSSRSVFVKVPRESGPRYEILAGRLHREFEITTAVKRAFPETSQMEVVTPAGFIGEAGGLVTWEVHGESLQDMLGAELRLPLRASPSKLGCLCEIAGHWLRRFHGLGLAAGEDDVRGSVTRYCEDRLHALAGTADSQVPAALAESLGHAVRTWVDLAFAGRDDEVVLCHNDYSPHNIIATENGICVLDFSFAGPGLPAFDLACFWHKMEDLKSSMFHSSRALAMLQDRFLEAYGAPFDLAQPAAKLGMARLVLSKMLTMLDERSVRPDKWIERRSRYARYLALLQSRFEPCAR